jgi:superfamily II DNA or RNA helicase
MAEVTFARKDANTGYYGQYLWLPKAHINVRSIKAGLEFPIMGEEGLEYLRLWEEDKDHVIVPREFIPRSQYSTLSFPIFDIGPHKFPVVEIRSTIQLDAKSPDKNTQKLAHDAMVEAHSGVLNLSCGKGKSIIALHAIATMRVPALIIVNNTTLIDQWNSYIRQFLVLPEEVGLVQGPPDKWVWRRPITLAMLHSLALYAERLPAGMAQYFGVVIWDEIHHLSAPLFSTTAPLFPGKRYGLTATISREDGLEAVYSYNVGDVFFKDLSQEIRPKIHFQNHPLQINWKSKETKAAILGKDGKLNIPKLRTFIGTLPTNNEFIATCVRQAVEAGRKILVLSHSVDQLGLLHEMFPESGLCTGKEKPAHRIEVLRGKNPVFGTTQLVREGLDEDTLDALFFVTPFGSGAVAEGGHNTLQQGMGRTQRVRTGKKVPVVVIIDHLYIPQFHRMCNQLKRQLKNWPDAEGGPYEYSVVRPHREVTG